MSTTIVDHERAQHTPHPVVRHGWIDTAWNPAPGLDYMGRHPNGSWRTPTGRPRHRAWQVGDRAAFTNAIGISAEFPDGLVVITLVAPADSITVRYVDDACHGTGEFGVVSSELSNP